MVAVAVVLDRRDGVVVVLLAAPLETPPPWDEGIVFFLV